MKASRHTRSLAEITALAAITSGLIGLLAWWELGPWHMVTFSSDRVPMAPLTAILFVLLGLVQAASPRRPESRAVRLAGGLVALLAIATGGLVMLQSWHDFSLPWDRWLLGSMVATVGHFPIGRMSPLTALAFSLTGLALLGPCTRWSARSAVRWTAAAANGATLVIAVMVAVSYAAGTPLLYHGTTVPMALQTALTFLALNTSFLLAGPVEWSLHDWHPDGSTSPLGLEQRTFTRRLAFSLVVIAGLIMLAGFFYLRSEQDSARQTVHAQLEAIATLKAEQIEAWRTERLGEARFLQRTPAVVHDVAAFLTAPDDPAARTRLTDWLEPIKGGERYQSILVYDAQARLRLAIPAAAGQPGHLTRESIDQVLAGPEPVFADLQRHDGDATAHLDLLAPIRAPVAPGGPTGAIGLIVLRMDPHQFLFPLVRRWPVPSATAESMLIRREGEEVVYLNELRYRPGDAEMLRRSVREQMLPAVLAVRGETGVREGVDYRGVPVLSVGHVITGSPWILLTKVDQAEIFTPIQRELRQTALLVGLLLVAVVLTGIVLWRQRHADTLRRALAAEQESKAIAERFGLVMRHANDCIFLMDEAGRILEANERALTTYGYSLAELRALPPGGLRPPAARTELARQFQLFRSPDGAVFETVHQRKDGTIIPVEVSGRSVVMDGRCQILGIYRDITERSRLTDALRQQEAQFRAVFDNAPVGISLTSGGVLRLVNAEHAKITGVPMDKSAEPGIFGRVSHPEDYARQTALAEKFIRGEIDHYTVEKRYLHPDGRVQWAELSSRFFRGPDLGEDWIVTTVTDIAERKAHEREIERLNRIYFVISQVNQTIVRAKTRAELFPEICRVLVEFGRFKIAWIGWLNPETKLIDPIAVAGDEHGYVSGIRISCDGTVPEGRGPSGTAFREGRVNICNDFFGDPALQPWHERARASGFKSSIALPLREDGMVRSLLTVYAPEKDFFGPQEISLLEEAAGDLSFALDVLAGNDRRLAAEAALQRSKEDFSRVFMSSPTAVCITTAAEGRFMDLNEAWERLGGYRRDEVIGRTTIELQVWTEAGDRDEIRRLMATEHRISGRETRFRRRDGALLDTLLSVECIGFAGEPCLISTIIDITGQKQAQQKLTEQIEELRRWHEATLGREDRILDLKREVNELLVRAGATPRYPSATQQKGGGDA